MWNSSTAAQLFFVFPLLRKSGMQIVKKKQNPTTYTKLINLFWETIQVECRWKITNAENKNANHSLKHKIICVICSKLGLVTCKRVIQICSNFTISSIPFKHAMLQNDDIMNCPWTKVFCSEWLIHWSFGRFTFTWPGTVRTWRPWVCLHEFKLYQNNN